MDLKHGCVCMDLNCWDLNCWDFVFWDFVFWDLVFWDCLGLSCFLHRSFFCMFFTVLCFSCTFFTGLCFSCMFFTVEGVFCLGSCSIESAGWRPRTFLDCLFLGSVFDGEGVAGLAAGRDRLTVPHVVGHQGGVQWEHWCRLRQEGPRTGARAPACPPLCAATSVLLPLCCYLCAAGGLLRAVLLDHHLAAGGLVDHHVIVGGGSRHISSCV